MALPVLVGDGRVDVLGDARGVVAERLLDVVDPGGIVAVQVEVAQLRDQAGDLVGVVGHVGLGGRGVGEGRGLEAVDLELARPVVEEQDQRPRLLVHPDALGVVADLTGGDLQATVATIRALASPIAVMTVIRRPTVQRIVRMSGCPLAPRDMCTSRVRSGTPFGR